MYFRRAQLTRRVTLRSTMRWASAKQARSFEITTHKTKSSSQPFSTITRSNQVSFFTFTHSILIKDQERKHRTEFSDHCKCECVLMHFLCYAYREFSLDLNIGAKETKGANCLFKYKWSSKFASFDSPVNAHDSKCGQIWHRGVQVRQSWTQNFRAKLHDSQGRKHKLFQACDKSYAPQPRSYGLPESSLLENRERDF